MTFSNLDLGIIKSILIDKNIGLEFCHIFSSEIFQKDLREFVNLIIEYYKIFKLPPTLRVLLDRADNNQEQQFYINKIWQSIDELEYDTKEYSYDLTKIKKRFTHELILNIETKVNDAESKGQDVDAFAIKQIEHSLQRIKSLNNKQAFTQKTLKENVDAFKNSYAAKKQNPDLGKGIMTGYSVIDRCTNGFHDSELIIFGGNTGAGKSMVLNNIAIQCWMQQNTIRTPPEDYLPGCNVLYFSLEMPYQDCESRTFGRLADIPLRKVSNAQLDQDQEDRLDLALEFIKNYPNEFQIVDFPRDATIDDLELRYLDAKRDFDPKIVVVDYMLLMNDYDIPEGTPDWLKQSLIAGRLHEFARSHQITVLSAVQLNEDDNGKVKKEKGSEESVGIGRVGRSKAIIHHANVYIQLIKRQNEEEYSNLLYQFVKNRSGENGVRGSFKKNFAHATLLDIPQTDEVNETGDISRLITKPTDISSSFNKRQEAASNVIKNIEQRNAKRLTPQEELDQEEQENEFA